MIDPKSEFDAVLFDLDGTLADTAPDLVAALNRLRAELGFPSAAEAPLRPLAGRGAIAILEAGLPELDEHQRLAFRDRYLELYHGACWDRSRPYDGISDCLLSIETAGRVWGVVTNKPGWLAEPLLAQSGWLARSACLVAGDTVARAKPFPDPVLEACRRLGVEPSRAVLVGDDLRDVQAGRDAGVRTIAAAWGYVPSDQRVSDWGADLVLDTPHQLSDWLRRRWSLAA